MTTQTEGPLRTAAAQEYTTSVYSDRRAAEKAMQALEAEGVPPDHLTLLGPYWQDTLGVADISREFDRFMLSGMRLGLGIGALLGALVGFVFLWIPIVGPVLAIGPLAPTFVALIGGAVEGAAGGAALGLLIGWGAAELVAAGYDTAQRKEKFLLIVQSVPGNSAGVPGIARPEIA